MRIALLVIVLLGIGLGAGFALADVGPGAPPDAQRLRAIRAEGAQRAYADALARLKAGTGTVENAYTWSTRWHDAERAVGDAANADARATERAKLIEGLVRERVATGTLPAAAQFEAQWWRADAELAAPTH